MTLARQPLFVCGDADRDCIPCVHAFPHKKITEFKDGACGDTKPYCTKERPCFLIHNSTPAPDEKCYIITETGMNLAIAVLKSNRLYDAAESVLREIRPHTPALDFLSKENLTVGAVMAYEAGVPDGAKSEHERTHSTKIICLCGSTRFTREMLIKQWELTKQGYIVLSWCALPDDYYQGEEKAHVGDQEGVKVFVDEIHKRKIDLSDEVFVINIDGYIGNSTRSEINYALAHNKPVRYLESLQAQPENTSSKEERTDDWKPI